MSICHPTQSTNCMTNWLMSCNDALIYLHSVLHHYTVNSLVKLIFVISSVYSSVGHFIRVQCWPPCVLVLMARTCRKFSRFWMMLALHLLAGSSNLFLYYEYDFSSASITTEIWQVQIPTLLFQFSCGWTRLFWMWT